MSVAAWLVVLQVWLDGPVQSWRSEWCGLDPGHRLVKEASGPWGGRDGHLEKLLKFVLLHCGSLQGPWESLWWSDRGAGDRVSATSGPVTFCLLTALP